MVSVFLLRRAALALLLAGSLAGGLAAPVRAQDAAYPAPPDLDPCMGRLGRAELTQTTSSTYFRFFTPGEATVQVHVEGAVQQPGLYEVGLGTNLGRVLALAGGPRYDVREPGRRRSVEVRLFRPHAGAEPIYATTLQDTATNTAVYPALCEGDMMLVDVVEKQGLFTWQTVATIAGGISAAAFLIQAFSN
jgi:hypothetical protein